MALALAVWALLSVCQVIAQVCEAPSACEVTVETGEAWPRPGAALLQTDATLGPGGLRTLADLPARHKASLLLAARDVHSSERRAALRAKLGPIVSTISVIEKDVQILKTSVRELEVNVGTEQDALDKTSAVATGAEDDAVAGAVEESAHDLSWSEMKIGTEVDKALSTTSNEPSTDIVTDDVEAVTEEVAVEEAAGLEAPDSEIFTDSVEEAAVAESAVSDDVGVTPTEELDAAIAESAVSGDVGIEDDDDLLGPEGEDLAGEGVAEPVLEEPSSLLETAQGTVPKAGTLRKRIVILETDVANLLSRTGALENDILAGGTYMSLLALSAQGSGVSVNGLKGRVSLLAAKVADLKKRVSILTSEVLG